MISLVKGPTRKKLKGKAEYRERVVKRANREKCVERDGYCRLQRDGVKWHKCEGPSEWAHMVGRAHTRGMEPEVRHATQTSLMLCKKAHDDYDGKIGGKQLWIRAMTDGGADGELDYRHRPDQLILKAARDPKVTPDEFIACVFEVLAETPGPWPNYADAYSNCSLWLRMPLEEFIEHVWPRVLTLRSGTDDVVLH